MRMRRSILTLLTTATLSIGLMAHSMGGPPPGKGGGGAGGGDETPTPPIFPTHPDLEYELTLIAYPHNETSADGYAVAINDSGCAVGCYYTAENSDNSWFYDPASNSNQTVDFRDISNVEIPADARVLVRGMNDFGLAVGGIIYSDGEIDGFALDTNTGDLEILPSDPAWDYGVGIEVNNNGDIMGRIYWPDGTAGNYLYNQGSEGVDPTFEVINVPDLWTNRSHLNQAALGEPTVVVGVTNPDWKLFIHPKGGPTEITNITVQEAQINDSGTIFGRKLETFEIPVRKNKTETVTESRFYQLTDTSGLNVLSDDLPTFYIEDFNNSEIAIGHHNETVSTNSGTFYYSYVLAHIENLGVIDIGGSVTETDKLIWDTLIGEVGFNRDIAINNLGPQNAGQIIGGSEIETSTLFLLTPVTK